MVIVKRMSKGKEIMNKTLCNSIVYVTDTIFKYNMNELENEVINSENLDEATYLLLTSPLDRLSDLHLLFLIRRDTVSCRNFITKIKEIELRDISNN